MSQERILIGGPSRGGKSTLSRLMKIGYESEGKSVLIVSQDDYALPEKQLPTVRDHLDWEVPEAYNWEKMRTEFRRDDHEIIILEGLLGLYDREMNSLATRRIETSIDKETFVEWKRKDDRWGIEPEWYIEYIWDCYLKYKGQTNF